MIMIGVIMIGITTTSGTIAIIGASTNGNTYKKKNKHKGMNND